MSAKLERFHTIYWRQFLLTAGMVLLSLTLLSISFFTLSYNYMLQKSKTEMQTKTELVSLYASRQLQDGMLDQLQTFHMLANFLSAVDDMDLFIYNLQSNALLTSSVDLQQLDGQTFSLPRDMMSAATKGQTYSGVNRLGGIYSEPTFVVASPIQDPQHQTVVGLAIGAMSGQMFSGLWDSFLSIFWTVATTVLLLTFLAVSFTTMRQTRPIKEMAEATRRFAQGNFDTRVKDYGRTDEIGELAASFNAMADSLQETERQRREFIANISHELKTPMTTIAGYTDGILDGTIPQEKAPEYLQIISDESRRLSRLVRRMLDVSQLQSRDLALTMRSFDLGETMRQVLISLEQKISARTLDVYVEIPDEPVIVQGDPDLITQVIYNLLENACKFATQGSTLFYALQSKEDRAQVTVCNQGETIPESELPLLFQRFHKGDQSRSEDKSGVGLGLYIVKTILEQHHEKIHVTSQNGATAFSFTLPLAT